MSGASACALVAASAVLVFARRPPHSVCRLGTSGHAHRATSGTAWQVRKFGATVPHGKQTALRVLSVVVALATQDRRLDRQTMNCCRPAVAFTREHVIHGRSTFPSMSLLDLASAATHSVTEDGAPRVSVVAGATLAAPLELTAVSTQRTAELECCVDMIDGSVQIHGTSGQGPASKHLSAMLASAAVLLLPISSCTSATVL